MRRIWSEHAVTLVLILILAVGMVWIAWKNGIS